MLWMERLEKKQVESLEHMHKLCNDLKNAEESGDLSVKHFRELQKAIANARENLPPVETPIDNGDHDLLVKKFQNLSRLWRGPLEDMMEDSQRRQELEEIFPLLEDEELRKLLVEAQKDREAMQQLKTEPQPDPPMLDGIQALKLSVSALSGTAATTSVEAPFSSDVVSDVAVSHTIMALQSPSASYASSTSTPFDFSGEGSRPPELQSEEALRPRFQRFRRYRKKRSSARATEDSLIDNHKEMKRHEEALKMQDRHAEADKFNERVAAILEKRTDPSKRDIETMLKKWESRLQARANSHGLHKAKALYERYIALPKMEKSFRNLGKLLFDQGRYDEVDGLYVQAVTILLEALGPANQETVVMLDDWARLLHAQERLDEAGKLYRQAIEIQKSMLGPDHPKVATLLGNLAALLLKQGQFDEAGDLYKRVVEINDGKNLGPHSRHMAPILNNWAVILQAQGRFDEAEKLYQRVIEIQTNALGHNHPKLATSFGNLAAMLVDQRRYDEADKLYVQALNILETTMGSTNQEVAVMLNSRAKLLQAQGHYANADPLYEKSIAILKEIPGSDNRSITAILNNRATLLQAQGQYDEAERLSARALLMLEQSVGVDHPDLAVSLSIRAALVQAQGFFSEAEQMGKRALGIFEATFGLKHPKLTTILEQLANLSSTLGKYSEAAALLKRSLSIREDALGSAPDPENPAFAALLTQFGQLLSREGKRNEAIRILERAMTILKRCLGEDNEKTANTGRALEDVKTDRSLEVARRKIEVVP